jgi:hypothetical protein
MIILLTLPVSAAWAQAPESLAEAETEMKKAKLNMDRREYEAAIGHYMVARSLAPESSGPYLGLGLAYAALGRCGEAIPVLEEYLRRKTRDPFPGAMSTLNACRPRPASGRARLVVASEPSGAEVRLGDEDGEVIGRTPYDGALPPGTRNVVVALRGFRSESRQVTLIVNQVAAVSVTLEPILPTLAPLPKGRLDLKIEPVPGQVSLNGQRIRTPTRAFQEELPPGLYAVRVEATGHDTQSGQLWVRSGQVTLDTWTLMSTKGRERRRAIGIGVGVTAAVLVVGGVIALGVVFGTPKPETVFTPAVVPFR